MSVPRKPGDSAAQGGGASRVGGTVLTAGPFTDTAWHVVDGAADLKPGEYELLARGSTITDALELTYASCVSATEQGALGASAAGRSVFLNSPVLIAVPLGLQRLSVRALVTPPGAGYSVQLAPIYS